MFVAVVPQVDSPAVDLSRRPWYVGESGRRLTGVHRKTGFPRPGVGPVGVRQERPPRWGRGFGHGVFVGDTLRFYYK